MRSIVVLVSAAMAAAGAALLAQSPREIAFDANAAALALPANTFLGEVAGVATNSRGHVFVYTRTGHAVATLGDERTFYHNGSRLFQFDQNGKFVKEIGQGVYAVNFAQQVRVDPQDNVWIVDAGSNQVVKFDADGRFQLVLGRFGKAGHAFKEFSSIHQMDCRNPNEIYVAEITAWRVQKILLHPKTTSTSAGK